MQPIPNSIAAMEPELTEWRRDFHKNPELGYEETRTSAVIQEKLAEFGMDAVEAGLGKTGVVGSTYIIDVLVCSRVSKDLPIVFRERCGGRQLICFF